MQFVVDADDDDAPEDEESLVARNLRSRTRTRSAPTLSDEAKLLPHPLPELEKVKARSLSQTELAQYAAQWLFAEKERHTNPATWSEREQELIGAFLARYIRLLSSGSSKFNRNLPIPAEVKNSFLAECKKQQRGKQKAVDTGSDEGEEGELESEELVRFFSPSLICFILLVCI